MFPHFPHCQSFSENKPLLFSAACFPIWVKFWEEKFRHYELVGDRNNDGETILAVSSPSCRRRPDPRKSRSYPRRRHRAAQLRRRALLFHSGCTPSGRQSRDCRNWNHIFRVTLAATTNRDESWEHHYSNYPIPLLTLVIISHLKSPLN